MTDRRFALAWNPELGWQLLRRSENYQRAVAEFLAAAKKAGDSEVLDAYRYLSVDRRRIANKGMKGLSGEEKLEKRLLWLQQGNRSIDIRDLPRRKLGAPSSTIKIDFSTDHYIQFNAWFGDVIRFPVDPAVERLAVERLAGVWAFRPLSRSPIIPFGYESDGLAQEDDGNIFRSDSSPKLSYHILAVNSNFPLRAVLKESETYFREFFRGESAGSKLRPRWDEVKLLLKVIKLMDDRDARGRYRYQRIGDRCNPPTAHSARARLEWARERVRYISKFLLPMFERKKPKISKTARMGGPLIERD